MSTWSDGTRVGDYDWFLVKDSYGLAHLGQFKGYFLYREDYIKLKTLTYIVHKDAVEAVIGEFRKAAPFRQRRGIDGLRATVEQLSPIAFDGEQWRHEVIYVGNDRMRVATIADVMPGREGLEVVISGPDGNVLVPWQSRLGSKHEIIDPNPAGQKSGRVCTRRRPDRQRQWEGHACAAHGRAMDGQAPPVSSRPRATFTRRIRGRSR